MPASTKTNTSEIAIDPTVEPKPVEPVVESAPIVEKSVTIVTQPAPVEPTVTTYQFEPGAEEKFKFWALLDKEACPRCGDKLVPGGDYCNVGFDFNCPVIDGVV